MKQPITYVVRNGGLKPYAQDDVKLFEEKYGDGEIVQPSGHELQRKLWAICNRTIKENDKLPWDDAEELVDALKRAVGHTRVGQSLAGKPYMFARSMGDVSDFPAFFNKMIDALAGYLGVDPKSLTANVAPRSEGSQEEVSGVTHPNIPAPETDRSDDPDYSPKVYLEKMLALASDPAWKGKLEEHIRQIDAIRAAWMQHLKDLGFGFKVAETAMLVARGKLKVEDAKRLLMAQLPEA